MLASAEVTGPLTSVGAEQPEQFMLHTHLTRHP